MAIGSVTPNRRALVGGIVGALSGAAVAATAASAASDNPDAQLVRMSAEWIVMEKRCLDLLHAQDEALSAVEKPSCLSWRQTDPIDRFPIVETYRIINDGYRLPDMKVLKEIIAEPRSEVMPDAADLVVRCKEIVGALETYCGEKRRIEDHFEAQLEQPESRRSELLDAILAWPAQTIGGLAAKVRVARQFAPDFDKEIERTMQDGITEEAIGFSVMRDLLRMGEATA